MEICEGKAQWAMHVLVYHGRGFGHGIWMETQRQGSHPYGMPLGSWTGLGIPEDIAELAQARVGDTLYEHLITRYTLRNSSILRWAGVPEP
jgi:hypothetical protein